MDASVFLIDTSHEFKDSGIYMVFGSKTEFNAVMELINEFYTVPTDVFENCGESGDYSYMLKFMSMNLFKQFIDYISQKYNYDIHLCDMNVYEIHKADTSGHIQIDYIFYARFINTGW